MGSQCVNLGLAALTGAGFPGHLIDGFAQAERAMSIREWSEGECLAHLTREHGPGVSALIGRAQVALELLNEHPLGRSRIQRWSSRAA